MKLYEKVLVGILGLGMIALVGFGVSVKPSNTYESPKANYNGDPKTANGIRNAHLEESNIKLITSSSLISRFSRLEYDLTNVFNEGAEVPRIQVVNMPIDFRKISLPKQRKRVFLKTILPLVLMVNEEILAERKRILHFMNEKRDRRQTSSKGKISILEIFQRYGVDGTDLERLLRRVDIIPPSLALAQAAEESGWGTSRFAVEGNAIFGQYTYKTKGSLMPQRRDLGKEHRIRKFKSLLAAVRSYALNLNTHRAYRGFRRSRESLRRAGHEISGSRLAVKLRSYSERGMDYVRTLRSIIRVNKLSKLDKSIIQKTFNNKNS